MLEKHKRTKPGQNKWAEPENPNGPNPGANKEREPGRNKGQFKRGELENNEPFETFKGFGKERKFTLDIDLYNFFVGDVEVHPPYLRILSFI